MGCTVGCSSTLVNLAYLNILKILRLTEPNFDNVHWTLVLDLKAAKYNTGISRTCSSQNWAKPALTLYDTSLDSGWSCHRLHSSYYEPLGLLLVRKIHLDALFTMVYNLDVDLETTANLVVVGVPLMFWRHLSEHLVERCTSADSYILTSTSTMFIRLYTLHEPSAGAWFHSFRRTTSFTPMGGHEVLLQFKSPYNLE